MHVIGTAGHVDHGKTSLLRALTGMEPSRLAEERARGMTMQLGFVWLAGADGRPVGVIDVPGHADYRLHALAGAGAIDAFLFICAADDGWMPQSEEHLWALAAYGITHGVIVLTKSDLVDEQRAAAVSDELKRRFLAALGRELPLVRCTAPTGAGIDAVKASLFAELARLPAEPDLGRPRMHVDRVFTVAGQGTVVTGTLRDGHLAERQQIQILPSGKRAHVRSLQSYGQTLKVALPTSRVALQLANISVGDVPKDSQIIDPAHLYLTSTADLRLELFQGASLHPKKTPEIIVLHGGVKTRAKMIAIAPSADAARPTWHVRLKFALPRVIRFGERCLVLAAGADKVLGAGRIVDEAPQTSVSAAAPLLTRITTFAAAEHLALNLAKTGAVSARALASRTNFPPTAWQDAPALDDWLVDPARVTGWNDAIVAAIALRHKSAPTEDGLAQSALLKITRLAPELLQALLRALKKSGQIQQIGSYLKLAGFVPRADAASAVTARLEQAAADRTPAALSLFELGIQDDDGRRTLARLIADGRFVRLDDKHVMSAPVFAALSRQVQALITERGPITASEARDALAIGRKIVIMLLEAMDHAGLTTRSGDRRSLVTPKP